jgi:hypothetical protein
VLAVTFQSIRKATERKLNPHDWQGSGIRKEEQNVSEQQNRDLLERLFEIYQHHDLDAYFELLGDEYVDDYVEEYPQSGERIRGKDNRRKIAENYPGLPNLIDHSYKISGDLAVIEMTLEYDDNQAYSCEITEFEDGKVKETKAYFGEPFEAPEWRAQWVERM